MKTRSSYATAETATQGVVVTHGTDTLEETAYFLQRVLAPAKPVVMTAAMRPATALLADGPQNLFDAVTLAREPGARGVLAVLAGQVLPGAELRKQHSRRAQHSLPFHPRHLLLPECRIFFRKYTVLVYHASAAMPSIIPPVPSANPIAAAFFSPSANTLNSNSAQLTQLITPATKSCIPFSSAAPSTPRSNK